MSFGPHSLLDAARGVEVDLVRGHRRAEQADHEVEVERPSCSARCAGRSRSRPRPSPGRASPPRRRTRACTGRRSRRVRSIHSNDVTQMITASADRRRSRSASGTAAPREAAGRSRHRRSRHASVIRLTTSDETSAPSAGLEADPLANGVEDGLSRHRGDASAHLRVDDDPDDADRDHPHQLVAERRAGRGVEDEVTDVDEASDRGEDPERDPKNLLTGSRRASSAAARPPQRPRGRTDGRADAAASPQASLRPSPSLAPAARSTRARALPASASARFDD